MKPVANIRAAELLPGRNCPLDYRYAPDVFARPADFAAETLYVVGGLYGMTAALDAVLAMAAAEPGPTTIVFNGDTHWFDIDPARFAAIEAGMAGHRILRGNVETEIARCDALEAGCGCAYPADVDDGTVTRSNEIIARLRQTLAVTSIAPASLAARPMHLVAEVAGACVGICHGDAVSLAGWRFGVDALDDPSNRPWLGEIAGLANVDVFASTHTCLAAMRRFEFAGKPLVIANNGAAGMPNFAGRRTGLITRIGAGPGPHPALYGERLGNACIDALEIPADPGLMWREFAAQWPENSPAYISYAKRFRGGPSHTVARAHP